MNEANSVGVKIEDCQNNDMSKQRKIELTDETKQEAKTEATDNLAQRIINEVPGPSCSSIVLDDSGLHTCTSNITSSATNSNELSIAESVQSAPSNTGTDEILALTDDLRPKAVVPDMSTPAAAEINIATTDFPIEVSESEEDAIVFIRQEIFQPPLVELPSGSDTENFPNIAVSLKRPQQDELPSSAATSESNPGPSSSLNYYDIPPKSLRQYSSTSSDESNDSMRHKRAKKALLKRRAKRKRHTWEKFHRRQKRKSSSEFRSDATSDIPTSPKKPKFSHMDMDSDMPRVPDNLKPGSLPRMLDQLLDESDATSEHTGVPSCSDQSGEQHSSTPQLFDDILSYSAAGGGYSSDSEGSDSDSFNSRNRYHPYI